MLFLNLTLKLINVYNFQKGIIWSQYTYDSYLKYILKALIRHPAIEPLLDELQIERDVVKDIPVPYDFIGDESERDILITLASEDEIIIDEGERRE